MTVWKSLTLAGVGVLLLGASVLVRAQGPVSATITLAPSGNACGKTLVGNDPSVGDRIRARRNGAIRWTVINNCNASATVELTNWIRKSDGAPNFPFAPNGNNDCTAQGGGGQCTMTQVVRGNSEVTTYSYTTVINGVAYDPDIIIEQ